MIVDTKLAAVESSVSEIQKAENQFASLSSKHDSLCQSVGELSSKVTSLSVQNQSLQQSVESIVSKFSSMCSMETSSDSDGAVSSNNFYSSQSTPSAAQTIVDELADRDRRKHNITVYNFPEGADRQVDKESFQELLNAVFTLKITPSKVIRLGGKTPNKHRPLLLSIDDLDVKASIVSRSHLLRQHDRYKSVFIVPDRTKLEREKHKRVVEELKRRRTNGEKGLIIRNGHIVIRQPQMIISAPSPADQNSS